MVKLLQLLCIVGLLSCNSAQEQKKEKTHQTLYFTSNANDVYSFDIPSRKIKWHYPAFNTEVNDELCYFTIQDGIMTKSYQDGTILQFDISTGEVVNKYQDKEDETPSYYGYDFEDVAFLQFYQYPQMFQGNAIFANSHGEIKSVNMQTKKKNWVYIHNWVLFSSPKILNGVVYVNINHAVLALDAKTGKQLYRSELEEESLNEIIIDNGFIYVSGERSVSCYNPKLELQWIFKNDTENYFNDNLLITEKSVFFGGKTLYSADKKSGKLNWKTEIYDNDQLLSIAQSNKDIIVMTREKMLKIDKNGKMISEKKNTEEPIGQLFRCNDWYYYLTLNGNLYRMDSNLQKEEIFHKDININPNHRVDNTYFFAD